MEQQQIIISGIGGQGVLFVTRILAEAAIEQGLSVLTSETHGMAMRGGTVISHVKVGSFTSPLIRMGQADCALFLQAGNLEVHRGFLKGSGRIFINGSTAVDGAATIDATALARKHGSLVIANLVLLGFAVRQGGLFCDAPTIEAVLKRISPAKQLALNLEGFRLGREDRKN
ncbi:MAG: 2-oxoacid:acceptor oxidoreductase family protein [Deltaproteobacteria bacterium]|nr:2-oxoacid:acceptor oxidoreductase family protein [Deltaproteobacteria bacterium]